MKEEIRKQVFLSSAERSAGCVVEVDVGDRTILVEVPSGTRAGATMRARAGDQRVAVEVVDRAWGLDGQSRRDLAPRRGAVTAGPAFWERATEELVESRRTGREFAGAVYSEEQESQLVLTGLHRNAVGDPGALSLDPAWGALLWHTRPGPLSALTAFSDADARASRLAGRPLVTICHTTLSPAVAANFILPFGLRPLIIAAGVKGLLALDRRRSGSPLLLGRALVARVVYPTGEVAPVDHVGASLPREVFDRTAFALDQRLGRVGSAARRLLQDFVETAMTGRPPGS